MKIIKPKTFKDASILIRKLNFCHDASLRKVCFIKERFLDNKNGALVYPFEDSKDFIKCNIEMELLHTNFENAELDQVVIFYFINVLDFRFYQTKNYDYSDIHELKVKADKCFNMTFHFYSTEKKCRCLTITCSEFICKIGKENRESGHF